MTRRESIQRIVWALLAHADAPRKAVCAARTLKPYLGLRAEQDFRSLCRAAGLFARNEDGFYMRYASSDAPWAECEHLLELPTPMYLLTIPVPIEPRMRIAYSVFTGLMLRHLYQGHNLIPLDVFEGLAVLATPTTLSGAASEFLTDAKALWRSFQESQLARTALEDGVEATFSALRRGRRIGAIELPGAWKGTEIECAIQKGIAKNQSLFQVQSKAEKLQFKCEPKTTSAGAPPFNLVAVGKPDTHISSAVCNRTGTACLICGQQGAFIQGAKFFLPENKKQWYEQPGPRDKFPVLCTSCAYIALLSGIVPSGETSIVEFPTDNFLELFALYEQLQGVSGLKALKRISRVATLTVLPSRYLLLSKSAKPGQMDAKTQVYVQLRVHRRLLTCLERPMRVQVEGSRPNFWSEIHPRVAVGLSYFANVPPYYETGDRKLIVQRMTRALLEGRPFACLYFATQGQQPETGFGTERDILPRGIRNFEREFAANAQFAAIMASALGGPSMDCSVYDDVIDFSNYLLDLVRPLVEREVRISKSAVSGVARKYTELIARDFAECRAANFLYVVCQEADTAERDGDMWAKRQSMAKLYGSMPETQGKSPEEQAKLWSAFRERHTKTLLEERIAALQLKHGRDSGLWPKFLSEAKARTLALLMLNVRNVTTQ